LNIVNAFRKPGDVTSSTAKGLLDNSFSPTHPTNHNTVVERRHTAPITPHQYCTCHSIAHTKEAQHVFVVAGGANEGVRLPQHLLGDLDF
jgi:hypothetical protein